MKLSNRFKRSRAMYTAQRDGQCMHNIGAEYLCLKGAEYGHCLSISSKLKIFLTIAMNLGVNHVFGKTTSHFFLGHTSATTI